MTYSTIKNSEHELPMHWQKIDRGASRIYICKRFAEAASLILLLAEANRNSEINIFTRILAQKDLKVEIRFHEATEYSISALSKLAYEIDSICMI